MKKSILSAIAVGALAIAGAASAVPAVVAGAQPYYAQPYAQPYANQPYNTVYVDQYGRQVYVDQQGRHIVQSNNAYGTTVYGGTTVYTTPQYDAWGRPVYGTYAYGGSSWDVDGDGIANTRDRWPNDRRFY